MAGRAITDPGTVQAAAPGDEGFDSTLLARCIDAASEMIEAECRVRFAADDYDVLHSGSRAIADATEGGTYLRLADGARRWLTRPVISATSVTESGTTLQTAIHGVTSPLPEGDVALFVADRGIVRRGVVVGGEFFPSCWRAGYGNIRVVYRAGYETADMPADLVQACIDLTLLLVREGARAHVEQMSLNDGSFRLSRVLTPEVRAAKKRYAVLGHRSTVAA